MSNELERCPFCKGDDLAVDAYGIERDGEQPSERPHAVTCNGCGCMGPEVAPRSAAIEAWNRRAQPAEADGVPERPNPDDGALESLQRENGYWLGRHHGACEMWDEFNAQHQRILSAVTAERDRLQQDLKNAFNDDLKMAALREQEGEIKQLRAEVEQHKGMAACMDLLRRDLIEAGIVAESCPPMFMTEGVLAYISRLRAKVETLQKNIVLPADWEDRILDEMGQLFENRHSGSPGLEVMVIDDTQVGVEFACKRIAAMAAKEGGQC